MLFLCFVSNQTGRPTDTAGPPPSVCIRRPASFFFVRVHFQYVLFSMFVYRVFYSLVCLLHVCFCSTTCFAFRVRTAFLLSPLSFYAVMRFYHIFPLLTCHEPNRTEPNRAQVLVRKPVILRHVRDGIVRLRLHGGLGQHMRRRLRVQPLHHLRRWAGG